MRKLNKIQIKKKSNVDSLKNEAAESWKRIFKESPVEQKVFYSFLFQLDQFVCFFYVLSDKILLPIYIEACYLCYFYRCFLLSMFGCCGKGTLIYDPIRVVRK